MEIRPVDQKNRAQIDAFITHHWFTLQMVVHGESIDLGSADGFYALDNEIIGLITYRLLGSEIEILSLDSIHENLGVGTTLLNEVIQKAREIGSSQIKLFTTNDNLHALRFYQKRGFNMVKLHLNAVDQSRKIKPEIPLIGIDGIPIRHEIELVLEV